jgi:hypothetical protein
MVVDQQRERRAFHRGYLPGKTITAGHGPGQEPGVVTLDAGSGKNGVRLEVKSYSGGNSQQFKFPNVSPL